ncbi:MAG: hypothetical protein ACI9PY_000435 [Ascidiaceihabitans sp.]|jgi:hypothetical protein
MLKEFRMVLYLILGGSAVLYAVFSMPALTNGGTSNSLGVSQAEFDTAVTQELAFCQNQPDDINCPCFANLSGTILTDKEPRVRGAIYADKLELARGQAAATC